MKQAVTGHPTALLALCMLCITPTISTAQDPERTFISITEDLKVEQLTDGVWRHVFYHEVERWGRVASNGLLVVSGSTVALIDTPWTDEQTRELFTWVEEHFSAEITTVIATHFHPDSMGGLAAAHQSGARSYASKKTARFARRDGKPMPQTTFRRRLEVEVDSRTLELHAAGAGHTVDNIVVWIPDEKILFGGCLVRSAEAVNMGNTADADLERWPGTIETLLADYGDARWIIPGHGAPGDAELLRHTLELLASRE